MDVSLTDFLIVCPLVFLGGFVDSIAGGGGLITLPGFIMTGMPMHLVLGTNKLSAMLGTLVASLRYITKGYVRWHLALWCMAAGLSGSALGARLVLMIPERPLKIAMLILIPLTAIFIMRSRSFRQDGTDGRPVSRRALMWAAVLSGAIGVYDGVYGPGTGTFLILTLVSVVHLSVREANGATKMINLATNISALVVFLWHGQVLWVLGLVAGGFSMLGNYLGAVLFGRRGASVVRPVMLTVMVIFFIKVVFDLWC